MLLFATQLRKEQTECRETLMIAPLLVSSTNHTPQIAPVATSPNPELALSIQADHASVGWRRAQEVGFSQTMLVFKAYQPFKSRIHLFELQVRTRSQPTEHCQC